MPISEHREVLFHLKKTNLPDWNTLEELKDFKFALTRGYTYTEELWDLADKKVINSDISSSDISNFKKLASGKVDIFPMDEITGWRIVSSELPVAKDTLTIHNKPLRSTTGHLIISKKHKKSAELIKGTSKNVTKISIFLGKILNYRR